MDNVDYVSGLEFIFDLSPDPLCLLRSNGGFAKINEALKKALGFTSEELLSRHFLDLIHPEDKENAAKRIESLSWDETTCSLENRFRSLNGMYKWFLWNIKKLPDGSFYASARDVTRNKKQTLRSLELSSERFEYVTEATSDIIWDWNLETNEVTYSGNIQKAFGHTPGVNVGDMRFFAMHVHPDDRERVVLYPDQVKYGTMKNWSEEYRFRKADGEYAFVLDKGIVIRDEKGIGTRMIGAMQDITVLKQNELRIMQQKDQLMEIAMINAHEIRRPVATILGLIPLLDKNSIIDEENLEVLNHLEATTHELDTVIKRIIDKTID
jgi:PAS domain S-box-containing protein